MGSTSKSDTENKLKFIEISGLNSKTTGVKSVRENKVLKTEASHDKLREELFDSPGVLQSSKSSSLASVI